MSSVVYFIQAPDGLIKIGTSTNVQARLKSLQTAHGRGIELLGVVPGGREVERSFHANWSACRVQGEWFKPTSQMLEWIAAEVARPQLPLMPPKPKKGPETERAMDKLIGFLRGMYPQNTAAWVSADIEIAPQTIEKWLSRRCLPSFDGCTSLILVYGPRFLLETWPTDDVPEWVHEAVAFVDAEQALADIVEASSRFRDALPRTAASSKPDLIRAFNAMTGGRFAEVPQ